MAPFSNDEYEARSSGRGRARDRNEESESESPIYRTLQRLRKRPWLAIAALGATTLIPNWFGSFDYTNDANEMSGHTRLGKVISPEPAGPGLHFKLPLVDSINRIEISKQLLITDFSQGTVDNQGVTIGTSTEFTVPKDAVMYLLYGMGNVGNSDVKDRISNAIMGETRTLIGQQNTAELNRKSGELSASMFKILQKDMKDQYKIDVNSYRYTKIEPNDAWKKNNESAMQMKSTQIAEETKVAVETAKAHQRQVIADADYYMTTKNADAQAYAHQKEGEGMASQMKAERSVFASDAAYNQYIVSKAYKGDVPQVVSGTSLPFLPLPTQANVGHAPK